MHPSLHQDHGSAAQFPEDELPRMPRHRGRRQAGIGERNFPLDGNGFG
jgi:hypothetical protein